MNNYLKEEIKDLRVSNFSLTNRNFSYEIQKPQFTNEGEEEEEEVEIERKNSIIKHLEYTKDKKGITLRRKSSFSKSTTIDLPKRKGLSPFR